MCNKNLKNASCVSENAPADLPATNLSWDIMLKLLRFITETELANKLFACKSCSTLRGKCKAEGDT